MGGGNGVKLLGVWYSPFVARVMWALKLKGVEYEHVEEDLRNKSPLLLNSNPVLKQVPVLVHNGNPIPESLTIVEYIDEVWKDEEPILPDDPYERAMARFWSKYAEEKCMESIRAAFYSDGEQQAKAIETADEAVKILEEELNGKKFFGGDRLGLVDFTVGWVAPWLAPLEEAACVKIVNTHKFPNFSRWMEDFVAHPLIKDNLPDHDQLTEFLKILRQSIVSASK